MTYNIIGCGGTFDTLHAGHKEFLHFAFSVGRKVIIGLTSDAYVNTYKSNLNITPFQERKKTLIAFLQEEQLYARAELIAIDTPEGIAIDTASEIEALIVTTDTYAGAQHINEQRMAINLASLPIISMPLLYCSILPVSSSYIRSGVMNQQGELAINPQWLVQSFVLPEDLRTTLQKPFGEIVQDIPMFVSKLDPATTVTVGDVTTDVCNKLGLQQKISVVDLIVERKIRYHDIRELNFTGKEEVAIIQNPAGHITPELWQTCLHLLKNISGDTRAIIHIQGEEDLAVLPLLFLLPRGFTLLYGQPGEGMVSVSVTAAIQEKALRLLEQFHASHTRGY